jgi:hypothetical protein
MRFRNMQVNGSDTKRKTLHPSSAVGMPTEKGRGNYQFEMSPEEREKFDAALAAVTRIKATFEDWVIIGRATVAARKHADRVGGPKAFQTILAEQRIMPPLDKSEISRLEKVMARLPGVLEWRETLAENQRIAWAAPRSVINHCPVFKIEKEKRRGATPKKPTRLDNALEENRALKTEVEHYRSAAGDDLSFSRKDQAADLLMVLGRGISEHKQRAVMKGLVRQFGTRKQREAFGIGEDVPCGAEANRSPEAAEMTTASPGGAHVE